MVEVLARVAGRVGTVGAAADDVVGVVLVWGTGAGIGADEAAVAALAPARSQGFKGGGII